jgi:hypothetical protein
MAMGEYPPVPEDHLLDPGRVRQHGEDDLGSLDSLGQVAGDVAAGSAELVKARADDLVGDDIVATLHKNWRPSERPSRRDR